jgi:hypothetical protein
MPDLFFRGETVHAVPPMMKAVTGAGPHLARWDLDKTYLRTEFATVRDLLRTAFESPADKCAFSGAATLLREMRAAGSQIHLLSGSPEQMRRRIEAKLRIDGVEWETLTLKPNLTNVLKLRLRAIKDQVGYKLPALLQARVGVEHEGAPSTVETLLGDDSEADALVYSLYADLLDGSVGLGELAAVFRQGRVYPDNAEAAVQAVRALTRAPRVERILIHLERQAPPADFDVYGARLVPFYNYFQAGLVLFEDHRVSAEAVWRLASEFVFEHRFDGEALVRSYRDLIRRGRAVGKNIDVLKNAYVEKKALGQVAPSADLDHLFNELDELRHLVAVQELRTESPIPDYAALAAKGRRTH